MSQCRGAEREPSGEAAVRSESGSGRESDDADDVEGRESDDADDVDHHNVDFKISKQ